MEGKTHHKRSTGPDKRSPSVQVRRLRKDLDLLVADVGDKLLKRRLPRVQLEHLDPVEYLVHELHPLVLVLHLLDLELLGKVRDPAVERDEDDHHRQAGED